MKKITKRILCIVLATVLLLSATSLASYAATIENVYFWDLVEYGSYPQSQVKDSALISELDKINKNWVSYGYYSGNGEHGSMGQGNWMKYADFKYNGSKYRAVTFSQYRPFLTIYESSEENSYQDDNGYYTNNIYYFLYEPLKWRVIKGVGSNGVYLISDSVVDSQAFNDCSYYISSIGSTGSTYNRLQGDLSYSDYSNYLTGEYKTSSIKEWINNDFANTAFTKSEKAQITEAGLPRDIIYKKLLNVYNIYDSGDWIYQTVYKNMIEKIMCSYSSDYAKSQGVNYRRKTINERIPWWTNGYFLNDMGVDAKNSSYAIFDYSVSNTSENFNFWHTFSGEKLGAAPCITSNGVRPMIFLKGYRMVGFGATSVQTVNAPYIGENADIVVMLNGSPTKISFVDSKFNTITLNRNSKAVQSISTYADGSEVWTVTLKAKAPSTSYNVYAKYERLGWSEYSKSFLLTAQERIPDKDVYSFSIDECYDDVMYAGVHKVTVETGVDATKVQFYKDGNTWTYSADNASYVIEDDKKIWSINMNFSELGEDMEYYIRTRSQKSAFEFTDQVMNVWVRFK